jgi:hypothetical protein
MQFLHLSPANRSVVASLIRKGAPVIPEQVWCTYPCPEPLFDGSPLSLDEETDGAVRAAVALGKGQGLVTVMFPLTLPGNADKPLTLDPGFTVVADDEGRLHSFQCVLAVKGQRRFLDSIVMTPRANFLAINAGNVSAWDLRNHGRGVQTASTLTPHEVASVMNRRSRIARS